MSSYNSESIATLLDNQLGTQHRSRLQAAKAMPNWPDPEVFQNLYKAYSQYAQRVHRNHPSQIYRDAEKNARKAFLLEYANGVCDRVISHSIQFERFCRSFEASSAPQLSPDDINTWRGALAPAQRKHLFARIVQVRKVLESHNSSTAGSSSSSAAVSAQWSVMHRTRRPIAETKLQAWRYAAFDPDAALQLPKKGHLQWTNASYVQCALLRRAMRNVQEVRVSGQFYAWRLAKHFLLEKHVREVCNHAQKRRRDLLRHESRNKDDKLAPVARALKAVETSLERNSGPCLLIYRWTEDEAHKAMLLDHVRSTISSILQ